MTWGKLAIKFPRSWGKICESPRALAQGLLQIFLRQSHMLSLCKLVIPEENFELSYQQRIFTV